MRLQAELEECGARSKELAETVARNKRYMSYLEEVQEHVQEDYPELQDLLKQIQSPDGHQDVAHGVIAM